MTDNLWGINCIIWRKPYLAAQQHRAGVIRRVSSRKSAIENLLEALKAERASAEARAPSSTATSSPRLPRSPAVPRSPSIPRSPRLTGTDLTVTGGKKLSTIFAFGSNNETQKIDNNQIWFRMLFSRDEYIIANNKFEKTEKIIQNKHSNKVTPRIRRFFVDFIAILGQIGHFWDIKPIRNHKRSKSTRISSEFGFVGIYVTE